MIKNSSKNKCLEILYLNSLFVIVCLIAIHGCGTETGNPGDEVDPAADVGTQALVAVDISSQLAEVVDSVSDVVASGGPANEQSLTSDRILPLGSFQLNPQVSFAQPVCVRDGLSAVVSLVAERNTTGSYRNARGAQFNYEVEKSRNNSISFSRRDNVAIECNRLGTGPKLLFADYSQLKKVVSVDDQMTRVVKKMSSDGAVGQQKIEKLVRKGNRTIDLSIEQGGTQAFDPTMDSNNGTSFVVNSTITSSMEQSAQLTEGSVVNEVKSALQIDASAPLVVAIERPGYMKAWSKKTIQSGTVRSTTSQGARVVTEFSNLILTAEAGSACNVSSGSVQGSYFANATDVQPEYVYTLNFFEGSAVVTFETKNAQGITTSTSTEELSVNLCEEDSL